MVTLAVLPGMLRTSLVVADLANPGNFSKAINLLVSQPGIVGLGLVRAPNVRGTGDDPEPAAYWTSDDPLGGGPRGAGVERGPRPVGWVRGLQLCLPADRLLEPAIHDERCSRHTRAGLQQR